MESFLILEGEIYNSAHTPTNKLVLLLLLLLLLLLTNIKVNSKLGSKGGKIWKLREGWMDGL